jgi:tripeptide aminopeptidase
MIDHQDSDRGANSSGQGEEFGDPAAENMRAAGAFRPVEPLQSFLDLQRLATQNLTTVIGIDSRSDEASETIPSTEGQRELSNYLADFFSTLGYEIEQDPFANLIVTIPSNLPAGQLAPKIALMVHIDTADGTEAVRNLQHLPDWQGDTVPYPGNERLNVSIENYPKLATFRGEDLLYGPGSAPIGLDDKVGMAELMTLAQILATNTAIPHGDVQLVFRPDEEIGRMEAVEGLAEKFQREGVRYGYTIDGLAPFEISVENFNASTARIAFTGEVTIPPGSALVRRVDVDVVGVATHGDSAKEEGHLNALTVFSRAIDNLAANDHIVPVSVDSKIAIETNATLQFAVYGNSEGELDANQAELERALRAQIAPHEWKGATLMFEEHVSQPAAALQFDDSALQLARHLSHFLSGSSRDEGTTILPLLPEESDGRQGYSNPFSATKEGEQIVLHYRLRDFEPEQLRSREQYIENLVEQLGSGTEQVEVMQQYVNMGPVLMEYPELIAFAREAAASISDAAHVRPIRGGTGVDPFLDKDIPIANLGTGYWGPESEKEITSKQAVARGTQWLVNLVQRIALEKEES